MLCCLQLGFLWSSQQSRQVISFFNCVDVLPWLCLGIIHARVTNFCCGCASYLIRSVLHASLLVHSLEYLKIRIQKTISQVARDTGFLTSGDHIRMPAWDSHSQQLWALHTWVPQLCACGICSYTIPTLLPEKLKEWKKTTKLSHVYGCHCSFKAHLVIYHLMSGKFMLSIMFYLLSEMNGI